jgi:hypothetical protein
VWLDRLRSRSLRLLLLDVRVALRPRPWLAEEEVDDCDESRPRGGGESRLPAGERGDAALGDTDTPTPLAPLGEEDRMAGEGVRLRERDFDRDFERDRSGDGAGPSVSISRISAPVLVLPRRPRGSSRARGGRVGPNSTPRSGPPR